MDKNKEPGQVLIDLRNKFREATTMGLLSGDQKAIFELTMISILNEAEEQRQRCLKLKHQYEREATRAEAQATSFKNTQNLIYTVFGSVVDKVSQTQIEEEKEDADIKDEKQDISDEEAAALLALAKKQEGEKTPRRSTRKKTSKKATKKTAS